MTPEQKSKQATENANSKRIAWQREAIRCKALTEERDKEIARLSAMLTAQTKNSDEWRTRYRDEERAWFSVPYATGDSVSAQRLRADSGGHNRRHAMPVNINRAGRQQKAFRLPVVHGRRSSVSNDDFERACLVHIERLQNSLGPYDSAMMATFCEAVRMVREYSDVMQVRTPNAEAHGRRSRTVQPLVGSLDSET